MFLHRVLPLPASSPLIPPGHHANVRPDSLQEHRIMNEHDYGALEPSLTASTSPQSPSLPTYPEPPPTAPPPANEPPKAQADPARVSRRRNYALTDVYQDTTPPARTLSTAVTPAPTEERSRPTVSPSQVCLCQPDPKVPRPRNAFILFRQHHQAEVARKNPGAANPEISKIIGECWQQSSPETKIRWKKLAEEEKLRHQRQYPEYRYQPRRPGRASASSASGDSDPTKCSKCGGRSMTAARLPSPMRASQSAKRSSTATKPAGPSEHVVTRDQQPSPPSTGSSTRMVGYLNSPPLAQPPRQVNRASYTSSYDGVQYAGYPKGSMGSPLISPDAKRRRFDSPAFPPANSRHGSVATVVTTPYEVAHRRPSSAAAPPELLTKAFAFSHPGAPVSPPNASARPSGPNALTPLRTAHNAQSKSVEAMVMSISPLGKVRTLAKISRPLPDPGPASPPYATRGAILAVEGIDDEVLKTVVSHLRTRLQQNNDHAVKLYYGGNFVAKHEAPSFADWLRLIQSWHHDTAEMRNFITNVPSRSSTASPASSADRQAPSKSSAEPETRNGSELGLENRHALNADSMDLSGADDASTGIKRKASVLDSETGSAMPVAIIPRYQLTLTDAAAFSIPIGDDYSPSNHWQWIATTWRGILGPDVTIVVQSHGSGDEATGPDGKKAPDVEVRLADYRAIVVRHDKGARISESALRRVGFEVEEWLRGRSERASD